MLTRRTLFGGFLGIAALLHSATAAPAADTAIKWQTNMTAAFRTAHAEKKPMFVWFHRAGEPGSVRQKELFDAGAMTPYADRAVFVAVDPSQDDTVGNVKRKIEELGITRFPSGVLLTVPKMEELGRVEGDLPREDLQRGLAKVFGGNIEWNTIRWASETWDSELLKVYARAAAAKRPVVLLVLNSQCYPDKDCACTRLVREILPAAEFRKHADQALFVRVDLTFNQPGLDPKVKERQGLFMAQWNIVASPTLIVADITATGPRERGRVIGRFDLPEYVQRMDAAFDPKQAAPGPLSGSLSTAKPVDVNDLIKAMSDAGRSFSRGKDGAVLVSTTLAGGKGVTAEVRVSDDGKRVTVTVPLADCPASAVVRVQPLLDGRGFVGPFRLAVENGRVTLTLELLGAGGTSALTDAIDVTAITAAGLLPKVEAAVRGNGPSPFELPARQ